LDRGPRVHRRELQQRDRQSAGDTRAPARPRRGTTGLRRLPDQVPKEAIVPIPAWANPTAKRPWWPRSAVIERFSLRGLAARFTDTHSQRHASLACALAIA